MTLFTYLATDSVQSHHVAGAAYSIELGMQHAPKKRSVTRTFAESMSGKRETLKHFGKRGWTLTFAPFNGRQVGDIEEFLNSVEDGQTFQVWLYGTEAAPVNVIRIDEGHTFEEFMPVGSEQLDWFTVSGIEIREA